MMCNIDGQSFYITKISCIGDLDAMCQNSNYDMDMYDLTNISEFVQESLGSMSTTKKDRI